MRTCTKKKNKSDNSKLFIKKNTLITNHILLKRFTKKSNVVINNNIIFKYDIFFCKLAVQKKQSKRFRWKINSLKQIIPPYIH